MSTSGHDVHFTPQSSQCVIYFVGHVVWKRDLEINQELKNSIRHRSDKAESCLSSGDTIHRVQEQSDSDYSCIIETVYSPKNHSLYLLRMCCVTWTRVSLTMHVSYTNLNLGMQMTRYIRLVILPANVVHTQCLSSTEPCLYKLLTSRTKRAVSPELCNKNI